MSVQRVSIKWSLGAVGLFLLFPLFSFAAAADAPERSYKLAPSVADENEQPQVPAAGDTANITEFDPVDIFGEMDAAENDSEASEEGDEGEEGENAEGPQVGEQKTAFPGVTDEELERRFQADPQSLGSISIGAVGGGRLRNGVVMPGGENWTVVNPREAWATSETVEAMKLALTRLHELDPKVPALRIGDFSREHGGYFPPHKSHQVGRDVDIGFYYTTGSPQRGRGGLPQNMDVPHSWALLRCLITFTDVELILVDRRIQQILYDYALSINEDADWLDSLFAFRSTAPHALIQHARGHRNHFHLRFHNARAEELGRRLLPVLLKSKEKEEANRPPFVNVTLRKNDTLARLARRYGSSVSAIRKANKLGKNGALRVGRAYLIPTRASRSVIRLPKGRLYIPPRHLAPYTPKIYAALDWGAAVRENDTRLAQNPKAAEMEAPKAKDEAREAKETAPSREQAAPQKTRQSVAKANSERKKASRETPGPTKSAKSALRQDDATNYRVRPGDSLWTIARRHHVDVADLRRWNRLSRDKLALGQTLVIYPQESDTKRR